MEWMLTGILVVDNNFNDVIFFQNKSDVIEESVVDTVDQVVHDDVDGDGHVWFIVQVNLVDWGQVEIVQDGAIQVINVVLFDSRVAGRVGQSGSTIDSQIVWDDIQHTIVNHLHDGVVLRGVLLGLQENGVTLGNSDVKHGGGVSFNCDTVNFNDVELVVLDEEVVRGEPTSVDQSDQVGGVWLHLQGRTQRVIDQEVLWDWFGTGWVVLVQESFVVFDDEQTSHTINVLGLGVGVVPVGTVLVWNSEVVGEGLVDTDRTLGDHLRTIELGGTVLENTVEM
ncbi:hypothetical protein WICPIJ_004810 [Wickerhamomyces pijperi]|uniref:Uncharacterized protein n=1 Tax=Wickerhamomyces pijperi TaxID=599730 RepID=A0A9P8TMJ2_WICPI|nr:hypothetical protein WICPIJ_004810 [Wickerhamomyces pijperi]